MDEAIRTSEIKEKERERAEFFQIMEIQEKTGDLSLRVPADPFTDTGVIATRYNKMMDTLQQIESHLVMRHYDGFMSKGRLRARR